MVTFLIGAGVLLASLRFTPREFLARAGTFMLAIAGLGLMVWGVRATTGQPAWWGWAEVMIMGGCLIIVLWALLDATRRTV
jgi:hypothetical protein